MFLVNYFLKNKRIGTAEFANSGLAQSKFDRNDFYNMADRYEIINTETKESIDEGEILKGDDIIKDMFDCEESMEGFDWTLGK